MEFLRRRYASSSLASAHATVGAMPPTRLCSSGTSAAGFGATIPRPQVTASLGRLTPGCRRRPRAELQHSRGFQAWLAAPDRLPVFLPRVCVGKRSMSCVAIAVGLASGIERAFSDPTRLHGIASRSLRRAAAEAAPIVSGYHLCLNGVRRILAVGRGLHGPFHRVRPLHPTDGRSASHRSTVRRERPPFWRQKRMKRSRSGGRACSHNRLNRPSWPRRTGSGTPARRPAR